MEQKGYKYRLYPTPDQEQAFAQTFGAKRWIYNYFLDQNETRFANHERHLSAFDCNNIITQLKRDPDTKWLNGIDDNALKRASADLATAYKNFFESISGKRKGPPVNKPKFKRKYSRQSYRTQGAHIHINWEDQTVRLPKIKTPVAIRLHREFHGRIRNATISWEPCGEYYISFTVDVEHQLKDMTGHEVGIDLGLKDLAILSDGTCFPHQEARLSKAKTAHKAQQRRLSRCKPGSNNYKKQKLRTARAGARVVRMRKWYYNNISKYVSDNYDAAYMENLNISGMLKNRRLSRKIHETAWADLVRMIQYKMNEAGKLFYQIDRFAPSSKTCSSCGHKMEKMPLSIREWTCPVCSCHHDRDVNAAINIRQMGQMDVYGVIRQETGRTGLIPISVQKFVNKTERSSARVLVSDGSQKAAESRAQRQFTISGSRPF